MTRRWALPLALAALLAGGVAALAGSIETTYEATASVRINPIIGANEINRLREGAGLEQVQESPERPLIPAGLGVFERVLLVANERLAAGARLEADEARVLDTAAELVFPKFMEPERRLKTKALAGSPEDAAVAANTLLAVYLEEREHAWSALLAETRLRLLDRAKAAETIHARARLREAAEATVLASRLGNGVIISERQLARPPAEPLYPDVLRDAIVAGLIGALLGLILPPVVRTARAWPRPSHRG